MKKTVLYFTLLITSLICACNDELDIKQNYLFELETMPVQKRIAVGETAEIRFRIVKEGDYEQAKFYIRYFQPDGKGELQLDDGRILLPNDLYVLSSDVFRLYYTSQSTDQQNIDIYIEDNFGQVVQKTFSFQNESIEEKNKPQENFTL